MGPTDNKEAERTLSALGSQKRADPTERGRTHKQEKKNRRRATMKNLSLSLTNLESEAHDLAQLSTSGRIVIGSIQAGRDATRPNQGPRLEWGPGGGKCGQRTERKSQKPRVTQH